MADLETNVTNTKQLLDSSIRGSVSSEAKEDAFQDLEPKERSSLGDFRTAPSVEEMCKLLRKDPYQKTSKDCYKMGKVLGKGGFGKVHLAMHKLSRKLVAIKSLKLANISENQHHRIKQEIEILELM
jgi:hypothetical protein